MAKKFKTSKKQEKKTFDDEQEEIIEENEISRNEDEDFECEFERDEEEYQSPASEDDGQDEDDDEEEKETSKVDKKLRKKVKAKTNENDEGEDDKEMSYLNKEARLSEIKNKLRRSLLYQKFKIEKAKAKREQRKQRLREHALLGEDAPPKQVPKTIESMREEDATMVDPDDEEVKEDLALDQMSRYFRKEIEPKVLITTSDNPHSYTIKFCRELKQTIPNAEFRFRNRSSIKRMVKKAAELGYTDLIIINEDTRSPNGLLLIHLPNGPTAYFRMSNIRHCGKIKRRAMYSHHRPEVILNNFNTRLGHTVGRMIACLFHYDPQFNGRRVVTFHNQRDYIFFRHHRYEFKNREKVAIQEIGPRFTLKLRWLQNGTFDTKYGEYEWQLKRHEMQSSRRRFFL